MPTNQTANTVVAAPLVNPLNDDDLQALNHVINQAAIHADLIAHCKECGMNMEEHEARNQMHTQVATKIKEQFFPQTVFPGDT